MIFQISEILFGNLNKLNINSLSRMQGKFFKNLIFLVFLNLLIKPIWIFGIDRTVQNLVGSETYGFYFTLVNFSMIFAIFLDFGISNFNNRNIAQNQSVLSKHFSKILVLRIFLIAVYAVLLFTTALIIGYSESQIRLLVWVGFNQLLLTFILYLRSNISGLLLLKTDSFLSVLDRVLMIILCSILIWGNVMKSSFQIEWFVYAQAISYLITAIIAIVIVLMNAKWTPLQLDWPFIKSILKQSFPFAVLGLLMSLYSRMDAVFIERLLPDRIGEIQSGIYALSFRIFAAANNFSFLFGVLLFPIFSRMIKEKQNIVGLLKLANSMMLIFVITLISVTVFYADEIMSLLYTIQIGESEFSYTQRLSESTLILKNLIIGIIGVAISYVFGSLLTANGNLKRLINIAIVGVLINFSLNLILVPSLQAFGSSIATLSAQSITAILLVFSCVQKFRIRVNYNYLAGMLVFILLILCAGKFSVNMDFFWIYKVIIVMIFSLILAFILKLLNIKQIIKSFS